MAMWQQITALGGLPFSSLLAFAIALSFLIGKPRCRHLSIEWCLLFPGVMAIAAGSQLAFLGWGIGFEGISFAGFSGHATRAAAVFPVASFMVFAREGNRSATLAVIVGVIAAALVAVSRVEIGAHSPSEAAAGFALGLAAAMPFIRRIGKWRANVTAAQLMVLCLASLFSTAQPTTAEAPVTHQWLTGVALKLSGHDRPYSRADWKPAAAAYVPPCPLSRRRFTYLCV
jgi:hypothetical protein